MTGTPPPRSHDDYAAMGREYVDLLTVSKDDVSEAAHEREAEVDSEFRLLLERSSQQPCLVLMVAAVRRAESDWTRECLGSGWLEEFLERQPSWFEPLIEAVGKDSDRLQATLRYVWLNDVARWLVPKINLFLSEGNQPVDRTSNKRDAGPGQ